MRPYSASLLFVSLLSAAAQTAGPPPPSPAPAPATDMNSYRDDALHLSYSYPKDYVDASALVGPAFQATLGSNPAAGSAVRCISLPFSRMGSAQDQMSIVMLIHASAGCLKKKFTASSVTELAQGEAKGISASGAKTDFKQPINFEVGGRPASSVQGSFILPTGQAMQAMVVCVLDEPDVVCWQFLSNSPALISTMSTFPVTFDGSPASPLVPPAALAKP